MPYTQINCIALLDSTGRMLWYAPFAKNMQLNTTLSLILSVLAFLLAATIFMVLWHAKKRDNRYAALEASLENDIDRLNRQLNRSVECEQNLLHVVRIQEMMLAAISHDIKTPLGYMAFAAERIDGLLLKKDYAAITTFSDGIFEYSTRIRSLIDEMADYIKIRLDITTPPTAFDLHQLVANKIAMLTHQADTNSTLFINNILTGYIIVAKKQELSVVVHNLLDNAAKNTFHGHIMIHIESWDGGLLLEIEDTGTGMPVELMDWLNSTDGDKTVPFPGQHGLGLFMVKEIQKMIPARIFVKAGNNGGTVVQIHLPDMAATNQQKVTNNAISTQENIEAGS